MTGISSGPDGFDDRPASPYTVYFQPETGHLLDLLGSAAVHGTPMAAVTELVVNAFDAIRNRVVFQRLALPAAEDASDPQWDHAFGEDDQVVLELFENRNGGFLRCSDTGIGLDEEVISQRLLCPGKPPGPAWLELDGKCRARGFHLPGRTARGLGFLTYFMLAEAVKIRSRRFATEGGIRSRNVVFKSEGPRNRSLLRSLPADFAGPTITNVTLRLKDKAARPGTSFDHDLKTWLQHTLVRTPCPLYLFSGDSDPVFPKGWLPEIPVITPRIVSPCPGEPGLKRLPTTSATLDLITALTSMPADDLPKAGVCIGMDMQEYYVPGLAALRCTAPWISYRGTKAMVWATDAYPDNPGGQNTMVALTSHSRTAWQGIHCQITGVGLPSLSTGQPAFDPALRSSQLPPWGFLAVDIDLEEPPLETLALNRSFATLTAKTRSRLQEFCHKSLNHMLGQVRRKHIGTLLAEQMEELEEHLRRKPSVGV